MGECAARAGRIRASIQQADSIRQPSRPTASGGPRPPFADEHQVAREHHSD